jgi:hypothetical protein
MRLMIHSMTKMSSAVLSNKKSGKHKGPRIDPWTVSIVYVSKVRQPFSGIFNSLIRSLTLTTSNVAQR